MSAHDHTRFADDVGAYLLGALEPAEQAAFEQHLAACPDCRAEVERLRVAADALPRSVDQVDPPASLKAALMDAVRSDARSAEGASAPERRAPAPRRSRWRGALLGRPAFAAAAAAVVLAIGIAAGALVGLPGGDDQAVHTAQVDRTRMPSGTAELVVEDDGGNAVLRVRGMQPPPDGHVYEVWLEHDGRVERSSLFTVARDGSGAAAIPEGVDGVDRVMVTREPDGGSDKPSEPPVVSVDL